MDFLQINSIMNIYNQNFKPLLYSKTKPDTFFDFMIRSKINFITVLCMLISYQLTAESLQNFESTSNKAISDTFPENQFLFNGRVWRNLYLTVEGDQFLFSKEPITGSVTMRGKTYSGMKIMYDIFKDEILIPYKPVGFLQLNKEMVDSFTIFHHEKEFHFIKIPDTTNHDLSGYYLQLYKGKNTLLEKFEKKIEKYADRGMYDKFYPVNKIYLIKESKIESIKRKNDLIRIFNNKKAQIRSFIRKNHLKISRTDGKSFVPVLEFLDNLNK